MTKPSEISSSKPTNLYGILFMLLNAAAIALLYTIMKDLTKTISSTHVVFFYKFALLMTIMPWVFSKGISAIYTTKIHLHILRGLLSISGSLCFMKALEHVEMVDATALGYLEQVLVILIGVVYFKEKMDILKALCIILSFLGAMIIVYPELINFSSGSYIPVLFLEKDFYFNPSYILVLFSIMFWALNCVVVKLLGKTEKSKTQTFYVMLFSSIISYSVGFIKWQGLGFIYIPAGILPISAIGLETKHIIYISILAACYFTHCIAFYKALAYAELATVMPFDYMRLVFTGFMGFIVFNEIPNQHSYWGYVLIMSAGIVLMRSESRRKKIKNQSKGLQQIEAESEHV